jgi:hypothetical protein
MSERALLSIIDELMDQMDWIGTGSVESGAKDRRSFEKRIAMIATSPREDSLPCKEGKDDEAEETYQIGKRDGYEDAIRDLDLQTGGDGEFVARTNGETVDVPVMRQQIIDRFSPPPPKEPIITDLGYRLRSGPIWYESGSAIDERDTAALMREAAALCDRVSDVEGMTAFIASKLGTMGMSAPLAKTVHTELAQAIVSNLMETKK